MGRSHVVHFAQQKECMDTLQRCYRFWLSIKLEPALHKAGSARRYVKQNITPHCGIAHCTIVEKYCTCMSLADPAPPTNGRGPMICYAPNANVSLFCSTIALLALNFKHNFNRNMATQKWLLLQPSTLKSWIRHCMCCVATFVYHTFPYECSKQSIWH